MARALSGPAVESGRALSDDEQQCREGQSNHGVQRSRWGPLSQPEDDDRLRDSQQEDPH